MEIRNQIVGDTYKRRLSQRKSGQTLGTEREAISPDRRVGRGSDIEFRGMSITPCFMIKLLNSPEARPIVFQFVPI